MKCTLYKPIITHRAMLKSDKAKVLEELAPILEEVRKMDFPSLLLPSELFTTLEGLEKQIDSALTDAFMIFYCQLHKEDLE